MPAYHKTEDEMKVLFIIENNNKKFIEFSFVDKLSRLYF